MTMYLVPVYSLHGSTPLFSYGNPGETFTDPSRAASILADTNAVLSSRNHTTGNTGNDVSLGYRWNLNQEQSVPKPVNSKGVFKHSNGKDWADRAKTGKIVMAPYLRYDNNLVHDPVYSDVDIGYSQTRYADVVGMGVITLQPLPKPYPQENKFPFYKGVYVLGGLGVLIAVHIKEIGLILANLPESPEQILEKAREGNLIKSCIRPRCVTAALADANSGTLDLLTEMAELPSTITTVFQGLKTLGRMIKDLKNRELSLTKQSNNERSALAVKLKQDLASLDNLLRQPMSPRRRHRLKKAVDRKRKKLERNYVRKNREIGIELADAIASVWLTYRYTMMPQIYLIDDMMRTLGTIYSDYYTAREKDMNVSIHVPEYDGYTTDTPVSTHRCVIKTMVISSTNLDKLGSLLSANILVTAWELMSKSLIVDWVLNVGDLLGALVNFANYEDRRTSYSIRIENQHIRYTHKVSGASFVVVLNQYERDIIDPASHIGFTFQDDWLNQKRFADLLAFGLPSLKKMLRNVT